VSVEDNADKLAHDLFRLQNVSVEVGPLIMFRTANILLLGWGEL